MKVFFNLTISTGDIQTILVIKVDKGSISNAIVFLPRHKASTEVTPEPIKGSRTISPLLVKC